MPIKLANNASGTLATAISASDTGIVLTTGDGAEFPTLGAGDYFYATITSTQGTQEIVKATARSGDSLTVVRAQEGTTAAGFAAGARFELRVTVQSVRDWAEVYTPAGTNAVPTTVQAKLRETVSVLDFGAVGDGVTDDSAAIQAAFDYARAYATNTANRCEVLLPTGDYKFSTKLTIYSNTIFQGPGTLIFSGSGTAIELDKITVGDHTTSPVNILLRDFTLKTSSSSATTALYADNALRINIENVNFFGGIGTGYPASRWSTAAVNFHSTAPANTFLLNIIGCKFQHISGDCVLLDGDGGSSIVNITQCGFQANNKVGIRQTGGAIGAFSIAGNEIEGFGSVVGSSMIKLGFAIGGTIEANHFEHSSGSAEPIVVLGKEVYASAVRVSNNGFGGAGAGVTPYLIDIGNFQNSAIEHNTFSNAGNAINVSTSLSSSTVQQNTFNNVTDVFTSASVVKVRTTLASSKDNFTNYFKANLYYSGVVNNRNASQRGVMAVKPGLNGNTFQAKEGGTASDFAVGDFVYNSSPAAGGYIGWVCTVAGRAHFWTKGDTTSGSNIVTNVTGAIWDWTIGDLITTDDNSIPAGTTVTNIGVGTITLSANATATASSVNLFGARFKGFGVIES